MRKSSSILISILLIILTLSGCSKGSFSAKYSNEVNTPNQMSMVHEDLNGYKESKITVGEGKSVDVKAIFSTDSGSIDAYIAKDNDTNNAIFSEKDIKTGSYRILLTEAGEYTVRIDAKNHTGSYSFTWSE